MEKDYGWNFPQPSAPCYESSVGFQIQPQKDQDLNNDFHAIANSKNSVNEDFRVIHTVVPVHLNVKEPTTMVCPYCFKQMQTVLNYQYDDWVYFLGFLICLMGCCLGCCLVPCIVCDEKYVDHSCGACGQYIGVAPESNPLLQHKAAELRKLDE